MGNLMKQDYSMNWSKRETKAKGKTAKSYCKLKAKAKHFKEENTF
jgi:hypothetical protein